MGEETALEIIVTFSLYVDGQSFGVGVSGEGGEQGCEIFCRLLVLLT